MCLSDSLSSSFSFVFFFSRGKKKVSRGHASLSLSILTKILNGRIREKISTAITIGFGRAQIARGRT